MARRRPVSSAARTPAPAVSPAVARPTLTAALAPRRRRRCAACTTGQAASDFALWIAMLVASTLSRSFAASAARRLAKRCLARRRGAVLARPRVAKLGNASGLRLPRDARCRSRWPPSRSRSARRPVRAAAAGHAAHGPRRGVRTPPSAFLPLAFREALARRRRQAGVRTRSTLIRAALIIAVVALVVFGSLLRGADPIFASLGRHPVVDVGTIVSHLLVAGFFAWIVAGWARAARSSRSRRHAARPHRSRFSSARRHHRRARHARTCCSPRSSRRSSDGSSAASSSSTRAPGSPPRPTRAGLLSDGLGRRRSSSRCSSGTRAALRPGRALARRHTLLSLRSIVLLGAIIVLGDAAHEDVRALLRPHDRPLLPARLHALARDRASCGSRSPCFATGDGRSSAARCSPGLALLVGLNVVDPDAIVARVNVVARRAADAGNGTGARPRASRDAERQARRHRGRGRWCTPMRRIRRHRRRILERRVDALPRRRCSIAGARPRALAQASQRRARGATGITTTLSPSAPSMHESPISRDSRNEGCATRRRRTLAVVAELQLDAEVLLRSRAIASCRSSFDGEVTRT